MTPKERVLTSLNLREPDRLPTFEWAIDRGVVQSLCPQCSYFDFIEAMDLDAVVVSPDYLVEELEDDVIRDEWGVVRKKGFEQYHIPIEELAPIHNYSDLERYTPPQPVTEYRFATLEEALNKFREKRAVIVKVRDVFSTPRDLRGYSRLLMDIIDNPEFVKEMAALSLKHHSTVAKEALNRGADIIVTGDDYADRNGPIMSPKNFQELFLPYIRTLTVTIHASGGKYIKHTDGNIMPILDMLVDAGIDCIDPIDPIGGMEIDVVKKQYGHKVAVKGNVDCTYVLCSGSYQEVKREVLNCMLKASPSGGHIISSSNSIHSGVRPDNYRAMLDVIRAYGDYPINTGRLETSISQIVAQ